MPVGCFVSVAQGQHLWYNEKNALGRDLDESTATEGPADHG